MSTEPTAPEGTAEKAAEMPVRCTCADMLPVQSEYVPCAIHGWTVAPADQAICRELIWDGPYQMTCGRVLVNGRCGRHALG